ncbi:Uncharacterized protein conserved in bacteria [Actinomyces howellii]|uniref:Uncharacterized protein conserved in bacteria n=2 Tax=Actinomyces howellii TaxID=52771 RepID=A0A3S5EH82_9ACTO|nr:Uncharacterized protein conserved in bacteria [Actinomyces howellii]
MITAMNGDDLRETAHSVAQELPGSELTRPFGPDWDVYKVRGKVFALLTRSAGPQMLTVKADPEDGEALRRQYADIAPGYHMNKRHWVTLTPGESISPGLVREVLTISYLLVVEGLPRARRPVDPAAYAEAAGLAG